MDKHPSLALIVAEHSRRRGAPPAVDDAPEDDSRERLKDVAKSLRLAIRSNDDDAIADALDALCELIKSDDAEQDAEQEGEDKQSLEG